MGQFGSFGRFWSCVVLAGALLLAGCVSTGHIQNRVDNMNQSVGVSQNQEILLNVVRASLNEPLYFLSISKVSGSGTTDLKTGLPNITVGPGLTTAQRQYLISNALDNSISSNFDVGGLGSRDFDRGRLAPITPLEANLLIHQGFSRAMVFSVLVDKIKVTQDNGVARYISNNPQSASDFPVFQKYLRLAVDYGLTIETFRERDPDSPPAGGGGGKNGGAPSPPKFIAEGKPCFDEALARPEHVAVIRQSRARCDDTEAATPGKAPRSSDLTFIIDGKKQTVQIFIRSPYQIFQYLGGMLAANTGGNVILPGEESSDSTAGPLLVVTRTAGTPGSCFTAVSYDGGDYCVPLQGSDNTKRVFSLINQILALNTSAEDLPITDTVRIAP